MSGYLEVKYPFKPSLGLNPFKSWKKQWCILRPSPTVSGGASIAVYSSEAGSAAGTVDLPPGCLVCRTKSRTRPYAFAVFTLDEPRKPRILLATQSSQDSQIWIDKIKEMLNGNHVFGAETLLKDTYSVTVVTTELSRKLGLSGMDGLLTVTSRGLLMSRAHKLGTYLQWRHINEATQTKENGERVCVITVNSEYPNGGGILKLSTPLAYELVNATKQALTANKTSRCSKKLSKSDGDLRMNKSLDRDMGEIRRSSWYSGPSEISLDDTDLVMLKDLKRIPSGQLSRYSGARDLASAHSVASFDGSTSVLSLASGIYEEIADLPIPGDDVVDSAAVNRSEVDRSEVARVVGLDEPTYESVAECVYATMRRSGRRHPPPPLPPRLPFGTSKLGESWNSRMNKPVDGNVTRHSSLGSLPHCCFLPSALPNSDLKTKTLPKAEKPRQGFSVFRKRLKSDSRIATSPKSDTSKENKDTDTKKKRFDFTPTRDIFKSFKVSRKMKNLKIAGALAKAGESKSCEFLDDTEHVSSNRCSKSVECLEDEDSDLSIEFNDEQVAALALPQEIVDLIMRGKAVRNVAEEVRGECDYVPMAALAPVSPPIEQHYMVMSPRANLA